MNEWKKVRIGDFLTERKGRYKPNDEKLIGIQRLEKIDFSGKIFISDKDTKTDMIIVYPGDLVISGINVSKGAIAVYKGKVPVTATIHYSSYIFDDSIIDLDYFKYFVKSQTFIEIIQKQIKGGIKTEIKSKNFLPLEISLPDLETQKQIVQKISKELNNIELLKAETEHQKDYAKKLRQNILQDAIQGTLTKEWRKENEKKLKNETNNPDYNAIALFNSIKNEKLEMIKNKSLKKGKLPSAQKNNRDYINIPESWTWTKIDDLFFVTKLAGFEYTDYCHYTEHGEVPVIRAQNVKNLYLDKTNLLYLDLETSKKLERSAILKNCLLVTFIGAGIGEVATFNEKKRWHLAPNVAKVEPFQSTYEIPLKVINYFLLSAFGQQEIFKYIKATAQPSLSMEAIRDIDFPLPPLLEQKEIVSKVEQLLSKVEEIEKEIENRATIIKQITQSTLKDAFNGR